MPAYPNKRPCIAAAEAAADKQSAAIPVEEPEAMETDPEAVPVHPLIAKLSNCLKSLHELWKKHEFGLCWFMAA